MLKYLTQFVELVPARSKEIKKAIDEGDRTTVRKLIHKLSPQIQFFGITEFTQLKQKLEYEYAEMHMSEMQTLVKSLLDKLEQARQEVEKVIKTEYQHAI